MDEQTGTRVFRDLKIARGQVEGIIRMVEEDRYCIDISRQIMAAISVLKKVNAQILHSHMKGCVKTAIQQGQGDESLEEVFDIIKRYM